MDLGQHFKQCTTYPAYIIILIVRYHCSNLHLSTYFSIELQNRDERYTFSSAMTMKGHLLQLSLYFLNVNRLLVQLWGFQTGRDH